MTDQERQLDAALDAAGAEWRDANLPSAGFADRLKSALREEAKADVREVRPVRKSRRMVWGVAAAVLLIAAAYGVIANWNTRERVDLLYAQGGLQSSETTFTNGDDIRTGEGGQAILWSDEQRVTLFLAENSVLHVLGEDRVALIEGEVWVNIKPKSGFYQVTTPNAEVTVKGTRFGVRVESEGTHVMIESGEVTVKAGEDIAELLPGKMAHVPKTGGAELETSQASRPEWVDLLEKEFLKSAASQRYPSGWTGAQP